VRTSRNASLPPKTGKFHPRTQVCHWANKERSIIALGKKTVAKVRSDGQSREHLGKTKAAQASHLSRFVFVNYPACFSVTARRRSVFWLGSPSGNGPSLTPCRSSLRSLESTVTAEGQRLSPAVWRTIWGGRNARATIRAERVLGNPPAIRPRELPETTGSAVVL